MYAWSSFKFIKSISYMVISIKKMKKVPSKRKRNLSIIMTPYSYMAGHILFPSALGIAAVSSFQLFYTTYYIHYLVNLPL